MKLAELWPSTWIPFGGTSTIVAVKELHHDEGVLRTAAVGLGVLALYEW